MKTLLLTVLLVLSATGIHAQDSTSIELTTKDGRIVVLKPDGTWEFKKIAPQSSPTPAVNKVKSNVSTDSLPLNFTGQDIETLFSKLRNLEVRLTKGEFETTTQYEKRIAEEIQKPIIDNLTLEDSFSLVTSRIRAEYDADTQKMKYLLSIIGGLSDDNYRFYGFGEGYSTYEIVFRDINKLIPKRGYLTDFSIEVPLDVEEAKRLKTTTKAVAIVKLEKPYIEGSDDLRVRLIDVYLFDPQTGKILAKISEAKK